MTPPSSTSTSSDTPPSPASSSTRTLHSPSPASSSDVISCNIKPPASNYRYPSAKAPPKTHQPSPSSAFESSMPGNNSNGNSNSNGKEGEEEGDEEEDPLTSHFANLVLSRRKPTTTLPPSPPPSSSSTLSLPDLCTSSTSIFTISSSTTTIPPSTGITNLPPELLREILILCHPHDLHRLLQTSHHFHSTIPTFTHTDLPFARSNLLHANPIRIAYPLFPTSLSVGGAGGGESASPSAFAFEEDEGFLIDFRRPNTPEKLGRNASDMERILFGTTRPHFMLPSHPQRRSWRYRNAPPSSPPHPQSPPTSPPSSPSLRHHAHIHSKTSSVTLTTLPPHMDPFVLSISWENMPASYWSALIQIHGGIDRSLFGLLLPFLVRGGSTKKYMWEMDPALGVTMPRLMSSSTMDDMDVDEDLWEDKESDQTPLSQRSPTIGIDHSVTYMVDQVSQRIRNMMQVYSSLLDKDKTKSRGCVCCMGDMCDMVTLAPVEPEFFGACPNSVCEKCLGHRRRHALGFGGTESSGWKVGVCEEHLRHFDKRHECARSHDQSCRGVKVETASPRKKVEEEQGKSLWEKAREGVMLVRRLNSALVVAILKSVSVSMHSHHHHHHEFRQFNYHPHHHVLESMGGRGGGEPVSPTSLSSSSSTFELVHHTNHHHQEHPIIDLTIDSNFILEYLSQPTTPTPLPALLQIHPTTFTPPHHPTSTNPLTPSVLETLFHLSSKHGDYPTVLTLISPPTVPPTPPFTTGFGLNPSLGSNLSLQYASLHGHTSILQILLETLTHSYYTRFPPVDPTAESNLAVQYASSNGHLGCVKMLLEHGCDPRESRNYAVSRASGNGHREVLEALLGWRGRGGERVDPADEDFLSLRLAGENGHAGCVGVLIGEVGGRVGGREAIGRCLLGAACAGFEDVVGVLLEGGGDGGVEESKGLRVGCWGGKVGVVACLMGWRRKKLLEEKERKGVKEGFVTMGKVDGCVDPFALGETALTSSVERGLAGVCEILLEDLVKIGRGHEGDAVLGYVPCDGVLGMCLKRSEEMRGRRMGRGRDGGDGLVRVLGDAVKGLERVREVGVLVL
ncbi:hypothetical protein HDU97_004160 [Phlyctochytrium planicorne]|nr:hypothetical protein HDU97_004160 [Phlyctochytrium planicorne]